MPTTTTKTHLCMYCKKQSKLTNLFDKFWNFFRCAKVGNSYSHLALIACSSGSTGVSKSICMSHAMYIYSFTKLLHEPYQGVTMNFSSLYWCSGVRSVVSTAFNHTRIFTANPFTAELFINFVEKYKV